MQMGFVSSVDISGQM